MTTEPRPRSSIITLTQKRRRMHLLAMVMAVIAFLTVFGSIAAAVAICPCATRHNFALAAFFISGVGWGIGAMAVIRRAPTGYEIFNEYRGAVVQLMALKHRATREAMYECLGPIDPQGDPSGSLGLRCRYPGNCLRHRLRRKYLRRDADADVVPAGLDQ